MIITVDRIENQKIVFVTDEGKEFIVDKSTFPNLNEGDMINAQLDEELKASKKQEVQNRLNNLFNR